LPDYGHSKPARQSPVGTRGPKASGWLTGWRVVESTKIEHMHGPLAAHGHGTRFGPSERSDLAPSLGAKRARSRDARAFHARRNIHGVAPEVAGVLRFP